MRKYLIFLVIVLFASISNKILGQFSPCSERIVIQTDREMYIAGEEMFFKCCLAGNDHKNRTTQSRYAYLVIRNEQNALISNICMKLEDGNFSGSIYLPDTLSTGRYQLVSYTNYMRNFSEGNYCTKEIFVANRFDKDLINIYSGAIKQDSTNAKNSLAETNAKRNLISIVPEKSKYAKRDKIKISLENSGTTDSELANLSISVHEKTFQTDNIQNNIKTEVVGTNKICKYLREVRGVILEGNVLNNDNQKVVPNALVYLSTQDTVANLQFAYSDSNGVFRFQLNNYYNSKTLIISLPENPQNHIVIDNKYELKEPFKPSKVFSDQSIRDYLIKSQNIVQIQKEYETVNKKGIIDSTITQDFPPLLYPPVSDPIYPSDFVSLPDFIEISREIIPLLSTRKHGLGYESKIYNTATSELFQNGPLILLDGVPINSVNQIINLGSEKINKIEVKDAERYYGGRFYSGILSIFSKNLEINNIVWQTPMVSLNYVQLHPQTTFNPTVPFKSEWTPDFRQLLYWNPSITIEPKGKKFIEFTASDNKGKFEISVVGVTKDGNLVKSSKDFEIVDKNL